LSTSSDETLSLFSSCNASERPRIEAPCTRRVDDESFAAVDDDVTTAATGGVDGDAMAVVDMPPDTDMDDEWVEDGVVEPVMKRS
jgi:hypothetical protein